MIKDEITPQEIKPKRQELDWEELRTRSLQKGGFGDERLNIWPKLLNVSKPKDDIDTKPDKHSDFAEERPHQDERQIGLDTDRSFVLYPVEPKCDRETLQADLHKLLVSIFRKRPRLSYFQGYHDIVTVLFLTLPQEIQLLCAEKLSLHRLRDSMGSGLEPVLGLLRVTSKLLHLADPEYSQILERNSPLPFYALSNLLTLFSHDIPTLPLIQHVFDYLFCRPPISVVYLATAIILSRKKEVIRLEEEDEDGMIHSLLSSLPNLEDDVDDQEVIEDPAILWKTEESLDENNDNTFFKDEDKNQDFLNTSSTDIESAAKEESEKNLESILEDDNRSAEARSHSPRPTDVDEKTPVNIGTAAPLLEYKDGDDSPSKDDENPPKEEDIDQSSRHLSEMVPIQFSGEPTKNEEDDHNPSAHHRPDKIFLTDLLRHADALYKEYPPSHPGLALSSIMGPQSVVFTWSETFSELPSDNTAEAMVSHPELVVYPYVEIDPHQKESSDSKEENEAGGKARRKRRKLRKSPFGQMEKKTMLAGTVLVLGVAMAVYGIKARNSHGGHSLLFGLTDGRGHKDWRRVGGWVGGALVGMSEKIMNGLSSGS